MKSQENSNSGNSNANGQGTLFPNEEMRFALLTHKWFACRVMVTGMLFTAVWGTEAYLSVQRNVLWAGSPWSLFDYQE